MQHRVLRVPLKERDMNKRVDAEILEPSTENDTQAERDRAPLIKKAVNDFWDKKAKDLDIEDSIKQAVKDYLATQGKRQMEYIGSVDEAYLAVHYLDNQVVLQQDMLARSNEYIVALEEALPDHVVTQIRGQYY